MSNRYRNKYRNEYKIELGEGEYVLRPTVDVLVQIEEYFGQSIIEILNRFAHSHDLKLKDLHFIVSKGLEGSQQEYDDDFLWEDIEIAGINKVRDSLTQFFTYALDGGEKIKKE